MTNDICGHPTADVDFEKDRHNMTKAYGGIKADGDEAVPTI